MCRLQELETPAPLHDPRPPISSGSKSLAWPVTQLDSRVWCVSFEVSQNTARSNASAGHPPVARSNSGFNRVSISWLVFMSRSVDVPSAVFPTVDLCCSLLSTRQSMSSSDVVALAVASSDRLSRALATTPWVLHTLPIQLDVFAQFPQLLLASPL